MGFGQTEGTVAILKDKHSGAINGNDKIPLHQSVGIENLLTYEGFRHPIDAILHFWDIKLHEGIIEGIAMREGLNGKETMKFAGGWPIAQ